MGRISSSIGLATGFPIKETVDQLVALQAVPRDSLVSLNKKLTQKQTALTQLSALLLGLQFTTNKLASSTLYTQQSVTSSSPNLLTAVASGTAALGSYQFTPLRKVQAQQFTSSRLASDTAPLGAGSFSFRFGGFINAAESLDLLNGGEGFSRGKIRITDRSGASTEIDLSLARTVDDVLQAINSNTTVRVRAEAIGDAFRLTDNTGQSVSNLRVEEVDGGTTAASLGIDGINAAASQATGVDVVRLFDELSLARLNQGTGVRFDDVLADLKISFRDGSEATVDFKKLTIQGTKAFGTTTAANGSEAQVTFTAVEAGSAYAGVTVTFEDDPSIVAGSESVAYDADAKTLKFRIDAGASTADNIIDALKRNPVVSPLFTASRPAGSSGTGLITVGDTAVTAGTPATVTTPGHSSPEAKIVFTAVQGGEAFNDVSIEFIDNPAIAPGSETVAYDDSDPNNKRLVFQIAAGQTSANGIINALNNDPAASQYFKAARATGSTGNGLVSTSDTAITSGGGLIEPESGTNELTIGDVLATLNAVAPEKLRAEIAPDGDRIVLTDLTADNGHSFGITELNESRAANDLGLLTTSDEATITGRRLLGGLATSLLSGLDGGKGLTALGLLQLTDRSGATATVDLSNAETLQDVINGIQASGLGIVAEINAARDGIQLRDTTGATNSNLIVANGDATTQTAERLGIAVDAATTSVNSGSLRLQVVNENTTLASLNGGKGVAAGFFTITDSNGVTARLNVGDHTKTVGDLLDEFKRLGLSVTARINGAGDGIVILDNAGGSGVLTVSEGNSTTAANLRLLGAAKTIDVDGQPTQVVEGSTTLKIELGATDSLRDLVQKINDSKAGVHAAVFSDGSGIKPFRFTLTSLVAGKAGELLVDAAQLPFSLDETVRAQDALLQFGVPGSTGGGLLASSATNTFKDVLAGVTLEIKDASTTPVSVTVGTTDTSLVASLLAVVDNYNRIRAKIKEVTAFNADSGAAAVLQGDGAVLRVDSNLADLITGRFFGVGDIQSLQSLGFSLTDDGTLEFNQEEFQRKYAENPEGVKRFFSAEKVGFSDKFKTLIDQLAGKERALLTGRTDSLARTLKTNTEKVEFYNQRLEAVRKKLLLQFHRAEAAISKIQGSLSAINSIAALPPLTSQR